MGNALKTYGKMVISTDGRYIGLRLVPHVALKFKRVFPKIKSGEVGWLRLSMTPENCVDVEWFLQRYHLEEVTHRENMKRGMTGHHMKTRKMPTHCPRGHKFTPKNTRYKPEGWRVCRECGRNDCQRRREKRRKQSRGREKVSA